MIYFLVVSRPILYTCCIMLTKHVHPRRRNSRCSKSKMAVATKSLVGWNSSGHDLILCVELAGLPTPLTSHPLPSFPSTFPYLSQLRVILLDTLRNYPAPLNNFPKPLSNSPNKIQRSEGQKGHDELI